MPPPPPDVPPSPSLHHAAAVPKRQTLSRFFRRYPYGERRSRTVAPADSHHTAHASRRKCAGTSEFSRIRDGSVANLRSHQRLRLYVGGFMRKLYVELFFVMIVLAYGIFVLVQITMGENALASYKNIVDLTDITVGSILLVEITLKVFAYGLQYLRNGWNLFDALVIVASFVLGILAAWGTTSPVFMKVLRLRVILRVLRVLVVFERVKQRSKSMNFVHKGPITSPVEHVLRVLQELRYHPSLRSSLREEVEFAIDVIRNNRLYEANDELLGEEVDDDTQNWLRGEILKVNDTAKVLPDATDDDRGSATQPDAAANGKSTAGDRAGDASGTTGRANEAAAGTGTMAVARRSVMMKELLPPLDVASEFELQNLFRDVNHWNFDIFRVNLISGGNALCHLGYHLLHELAATHLLIEQAILVNFLLEIQRGYIATNPYHNAIHAADVMQTVHYFLIQPELAPFLRPLDRALALLAAGIHDFKHDGFNNSFHISTASEIALRYNDHAVLENFHVAQSFLVMKHQEFNVLGKLSSEDFKYGREMIIQMVLATDMAKHFEDVALFKANILPVAPDEELVIKNVGDKKLLLKMILHTCDVSNPAKERETMLKWTERVVEEFFVQGDLEKQLGLPVSPFMDRDTIVLKKMQVGFADFIVTPLFSVWAQILVNVNTVGYKALLSNREFWSSLADEFKPFMIKDAIRDLNHRKRLSQSSVSGLDESAMTGAGGTLNTSRVRRSVVNLLSGSDGNVNGNGDAVS
ncbi:3 5-cyclic nucleotide phosphodiesterase family protein, partial [Globisporangium splendens]